MRAERVSIPRVAPLVVILASGSAWAAPDESKMGLRETRAVRFPDHEAPVIAHEPPRHAVDGQALRLQADVRDPSGVFAPAVYLRSREASEYVAFAMRPVSAQPHAYETWIPAARVTGRLHYFVEAFDAAGNGPARVGSPVAPLVIEPSVPSVPAVVARSPATFHGLAAEGRSAVAASIPLHPGVTAVPESRRTRPADGTPTWVWIVAGVSALALAGAGVGVFFAVRDEPVDFVRVDVVGPDPTSGR